jgi:hypothetical protein
VAIFYTHQSPYEISQIENDEENTDLSEHLKNLGLLDPSGSFKFDLVIKLYCDFLYKWGLFNKRVELFEYLNDKPSFIDEKFGKQLIYKIQRLFFFLQISVCFDF